MCWFLRGRETKVAKEKRTEGIYDEHDGYMHNPYFQNSLDIVIVIFVLFCFVLVSLSLKLPTIVDKQNFAQIEPVYASIC